MNRFKIFTLGAVKQDFVLEGEKEYLKRLKQFSKVEIQELEVSRFAKLPETERRKRESELLLTKIKPGEFLILLDEKGKEFTSEEFATEIQKEMNRGRSVFCMAIGGAYGFSPEIKSKAEMVWSLSKLTFPFQMARLILVEQIYRTMSILNGTPYHKA